MSTSGGTSDARKGWFVVGGYKRLPNEVGGKQTAAPEDVVSQMQKLIRSYNSVKTHSLGQISHALYEVGGEYRRNM